jgi:hypothetical protein
VERGFEWERKKPALRVEFRKETKGPKALELDFLISAWSAANGFALFLGCGFGRLWRGTDERVTFLFSFAGMCIDGGDVVVLTALTAAAGFGPSRPALPSFPALAIDGSRRQ